MNDVENKHILVEILNELYNYGYVTNIGGNISFRSIETEGAIWIMPKGIHKGKISINDLVKVDSNGGKMSEHKFEPSSEISFHLNIYKTRRDINAVVHSHPINITALGLSRLQFLPITPLAALIGKIEVAPYILPGSKYLGEVVGDLFTKTRCAVILQNHGLIVGAKNLRNAANLTTIIERTADILIKCYSVGTKPIILSDTEIREVEKKVSYLL